MDNFRFTQASAIQGSRKSKIVNRKSPLLPTPELTPQSGAFLIKPTLLSVYPEVPGNQHPNYQQSHYCQAPEPVVTDHLLDEADHTTEAARPVPKIS
jgi:hypothetical protein